MLRFVTTTAAILVFLAALPAMARPTVLRTAAAAEEFCTLSAATSQREDHEDYDARRRTVAQQPVQVLIGHAVAPVVNYDRITASLELNIRHGARFVDGFGIAPSTSSVGFEMPELDAQKLWARYAGGKVMLRVTMLPMAWSNYDHPLCRDAGGLQVIDGEVLSAQLVDEVGRPLATFRTALGREMVLMKQHRIRGYLAAGTPVVSISALVPFPADQKVDEAVRSRLQSDLRAAVYGCYLRGLTANGRLQGALVLKMAAAETLILVDSLHSEETKRCVVDRAREARPASLEQTMKATVIFRLEEASL